VYIKGLVAGKDQDRDPGEPVEGAAGVQDLAGKEDFWEKEEHEGN
jgi:hypothetical protein